MVVVFAVSGEEDDEEDAASSSSLPPQSSPFSNCFDDDNSNNNNNCPYVKRHEYVASTSTSLSDSFINSPSTSITAVTTAAAASSTIPSTSTTNISSGLSILSSLSTMAGIIAWIFHFCFSTIPSFLYATVAFLTFSLPKSLFNIFSMNLTFTMNFTTL